MRLRSGACDAGVGWSFGTRGHRCRCSPERGVELSRTDDSKGNVNFAAPKIDVARGGICSYLTTSLSKIYASCVMVLVMDSHGLTMVFRRANSRSLG